MFVYIGIPEMTTSIFIFIKQEKYIQRKPTSFFLNRIRKQYMAANCNLTIQAKS